MILSIPLILYTGLLLILIVGVITQPKHNFTPQSMPQNGVSIIIPFRNEEKNLRPLILSLEKQIYTAPFQVILIDDSSTDNSMEIVQSISKQSHLNIDVLQSFYTKTRKLTSKQQALDKGIRAAKYDWIVFTDADMQFEPNWLDSLMCHAQPDTDLVFGHTSITQSNTILGFIQAFQLEFLFAVAYTFHKTGFPGSCMGNNILIKRNTYLELGGYEKIGYSITEDQSLYAAFKNQKKKILCTEPFTPQAQTYPVSTFGTFFNQVKRWISGGFKMRSGLIAVCLLFLIQNIFIILALSGTLPLLPLGLTVLNWLLTWVFTGISFKKIESRCSAVLFPVFYFCLLFEFVILACSCIFQPFTVWKGRRI